jgi:hypothetical protein
MSYESLGLGIDYGRMFFQPPFGVALDDLLDGAGVLSSQDLTYPVDLSRHGDGSRTPTLTLPLREKSFPCPAEVLRRNRTPIGHPEALPKETPTNIVLSLDDCSRIPNDGVMEIQGENAVSHGNSPRNLERATGND